MASWVVKCPHCDNKFEHSAIKNTLANYFLPERPKFPAEGQPLICKNCGKEYVYQQTDLKYQR
jgi:phage terminase large subunit GpA-like protein